MKTCPKCNESYPEVSDIGICIREFGTCVDCQIKEGLIYEHDITWIKFLSGSILSYNTLAI